MRAVLQRVSHARVPVDGDRVGEIDRGLLVLVVGDTFNGCRCPRAGFYAIQATTIRFGRDGNWYADDERITNVRIAALFSRHIMRDPAGGYMIQMGDERAHIVVDDTPYVVIGATAAPDGHLAIELNDRSIERLDLSSLSVAANDVLYCQVKAGTEPARFLRAAYYQLAPCIRERDPTHFVLTVGGATYPIQRR